LDVDANVDADVEAIADVDAVVVGIVEVEASNLGIDFTADVSGMSSSRNLRMMEVKVKEDGGIQHSIYSIIALFKRPTAYRERARLND
jgi:hypothetical protein